jgi:outer membrane protein TolC
MLLALKSTAQVAVTADVQQAINAALEHNIAIKNNDIELERMEIARKSVLSKYIPHVEGSALYAHFNNSINVDVPTTTIPLFNQQIFTSDQILNTSGNLFHGGVTAKAVLFSGGQIYNGAQALKYKNKGTALMLEAEKDAVIKSVLESFDQLALIHQAELLLKQSAERLDKESLRVTKALSNGLAIPYDRDKIKLASLELSSRQKDIANKKTLLALKIVQETGLDTSTILAMPHYVTAIIIVDSLQSINRHEIKALEAFEEATNYQIKKERGTYLPTLGAFGSYTYSSLFNANTSTHLKNLDRDINLELKHATIAPNWMVGLALKWEIFSGFERQHKIKEAQLSQQQIKNKITDTKEKVQLQLDKNWINYQYTNDQLGVAKQRAAIATNNVTLAAQQYKAGLISVTERLAAETQVYQEQLNELETVLLQRRAAIEALQAAQQLSNSIIVK